MKLAEKVEGWISGNATALVLREYLIPAEGNDSPFFPPTFAGTGSDSSSYCMDNMKDGTQTCLIDSVGSQANRMEPVFTKEPYSRLVPQIIIKAGDEEVNLCDVGHRAADALLRHSSIEQDIQTALTDLGRNNRVTLAKMAPTSFVFGLWDSRGTGAKLPRIVSSVIRAYDVDGFSRSAQYSLPVNYRNENLLGGSKDKKENDARSNLGFNEIPSTNTHGGVVAHGDIRRDVVINFAALRKITDDDRNMEIQLQRYILSLSMVAATSTRDWYLRQGCLLTLDPDRQGPKWEIVYPDGRREDVELDHDSILEYAQHVALEFGVGGNKTAEFDSKKAKKSIDASKKPNNKQ